MYSFVLIYLHGVVDGSKTLCECSMRCLAKVEELLAVLNAFLCTWNCGV